MRTWGEENGENEAQKQCKRRFFGRSMKKENEKEERKACSAIHPLTAAA
jgi:hypothetical protein